MSEAGTFTYTESATLVAYECEVTHRCGHTQKVQATYPRDAIEKMLRDDAADDCHRCKVDAQKRTCRRCQRRYELHSVPDRQGGLCPACYNCYIDALNTGRNEKAIEQNGYTCNGCGRLFKERDMAGLMCERCTAISKEWGRE